MCEQQTVGGGSCFLWQLVMLVEGFLCMLGMLREGFGYNFYFPLYVATYDS